MAFADHVEESLWNHRYSWLRNAEENACHPLASYLLSSHGTFITYDLEIAFCAGAWVSVIVLAHSAIDSTIRDTEILDYKSNSKSIFNDDEELEWLRKTRNALVHVKEGEKSQILPEGDLDNMDSYHDNLEDSAKRAMKLVYRTIYASPGT